MGINRRLKWFLEQLIRCNTEQQVNRAVWAVRLLERGYVTDQELKQLMNIGFKP
jgi:transcription initiation factor IIE alpha subunit